MEQTIGFPTLGIDNESLQIISAFEKVFITSIISSKSSKKALLELHKNGNDKAGELLLLLSEYKPSESEFELRREEFYGDTTNRKTILGVFDFKWSDFTIVDKKGGRFLCFNCEIMFCERTDIQIIEGTLKMLSYFPDLRDDFLETVVTNWLHSNQHKLFSGSDKKFSPRRKVEIEYLDKQKEETEFPETTATRAKAHMSFKIVRL